MNQGAESLMPPPGGATAPGRRTRRRLALVLKAGVTAALLAWIFTLVDWRELLAVLAGSRLWIVALVVAMRFGGLVLSSFKWQQLLAIHGVRYPLGRLLRWYLAASFLNHFLPSSIGGDGYRIYKTWKNERSRTVSVLAVFLERATGLAALALLGYVGALVLSARGIGGPAPAVAVAGSAGLVGAAVALWLSTRFRLLERVRGSRFWPRALDGLGGLRRDYREESGRSVVVAVVSFVFHLNRIFAVWLLLFALGARVNPLELTLALLIVELAGLLPVSLGGLGVVEGSFMLVMGQFGVSQEVGLATMLLLRLLMIPFYLLGALFYVFDGRHPDRRDGIEAGKTPIGVEPAHAK